MKADRKLKAKLFFSAGNRPRVMPLGGAVERVTLSLDRHEREQDALAACPDPWDTSASCPRSRSSPAAPATPCWSRICCSPSSTTVPTALCSSAGSC